MLLGAGAIEDYLRQVLPDGHPLMMVHSSSNGIPIERNLMRAAASVLDVLDRLVGPNGTLAMPTHPRYDDLTGFMDDRSHLLPKYDPRMTPSSVGLITELFRRRPGTSRSMHPLSSLAASGPLAGAILEDNLSGPGALPHGVHSGYYRCCQMDGLVVSLGVPLINYLTVMHVAEEVRDDDWPIKGFFRTRRFIVVDEGREDQWEVRERKPEFVRCLALEKFRRDLLREGILHESTSLGIRIDWANAHDVFDFMMARNASGYPYYFTRLAGA